MPLFQVQANGQTFRIDAATAQEAQQRAATALGVPPGSVTVGNQGASFLTDFPELAPGGGPSSAPVGSVLGGGGGGTPDTGAGGLGSGFQTVGGSTPQDIFNQFVDQASGGTATDSQQARTFVEQAGVPVSAQPLPVSDTPSQRPVGTVTGGQPGAGTGAGDEPFALNPPRVSDFRNFLGSLGIDPNVGAFREQAFDVFRPANALFEAQNALTGLSGGTAPRFGDFLSGGLSDLGSQSRQAFGNLASAASGATVPDTVQNLLSRGTISETGAQGFEPFVNLLQGATRGRLNPLVAQGLAQSVFNQFLDQAPTTADASDFLRFAQNRPGIGELF